MLYPANVDNMRSLNRRTEQIPTRMENTKVNVFMGKNGLERTAYIPRHAGEPKC
jgi:hypothetical protein